MCPPLSAVLLSEVLVTCGQPWSEDIKWKISKISNSCFKWHVILSSVMKSCVVSLCSAQEVNHFIVHGIHSVYATHPLVSSLLSYQVNCHGIMVLQRLCSSNHYM